MSFADGSYLLGEKRSVDRTGLMKIGCRVFFSSRDAAVTGTYAQVGRLYDNALFVGGTGNGDEAGNWICQWNFEKVATGSDASNDIGLVEELDFSSTQNPIATSPVFGTLSSTYGWDEATLAFPKTKPGGGDSPVFGTIDFLSYTCMYRQTQTLVAVPSGILDGIGAIDNAVPFYRLSDPAASDDRTWLRLAPKISTRGNAYVVTCEWMLSGAGGWNEDLYSAAALNVLTTSQN